jgi:hypothetical protein
VEVFVVNQTTSLVDDDESKYGPMMINDVPSKLSSSSVLT